MTYSTTAYLGTLGTNYYATDYGYDDTGRLDLVDDAVGTITDHGLRRPGPGHRRLRRHQRRPAFWSRQRGSSEHDAGRAGPVRRQRRRRRQPDPGDAVSRLHRRRQPRRPTTPTTGATAWSPPSRASRRARTPPPTGRSSSTPSTTSARSPPSPSTTATASRSPRPSPQPRSARYASTAYDDQGRAYQSQQYEVNPVHRLGLDVRPDDHHLLRPPRRPDRRVSTRAAWSPRTSTTAPGGCRRVDTDGGGGTTWAAPDVAGDHVLTQTLTTYDADGNPILVTDKERFNTDTSTAHRRPGQPDHRPAGPGLLHGVTTTTPPTASPPPSTSAPTAGPPTPGPSPSRPRPTRPWSPAMPTTPPAGSTRRPTRAASSPQTTYDALGRPTTVIDAYDASINGGLPTASANQTTELHLRRPRRHAHRHRRDAHRHRPPDHHYVYGVTTAGGSRSTPTTCSPVDYPDPTIWQRQHLGQHTSLHLRRPGRRPRPPPTPTAPSTPTPTTSSAARPATPSPPSARASTAPSAGSTTAYDSAGQRLSLHQLRRGHRRRRSSTRSRTSTTAWASSPASTRPSNGAVNTSTTPEVQYAYTEMSGGQNNSRPTSMTYPNGRVIDYVYNSGLDSAISRLSAIADDSRHPGTTLESYPYLGLDTIVEWDHPQTGVNLTYIQQPGETGANTDGGDQYTGLDRFGRVIDQNWVNTTTGDLDRPLPVRLRPRRRRALPRRPGRRGAERAVPRQQHAPRATTPPPTTRWAGSTASPAACSRPRATTAPPSTRSPARRRASRGARRAGQPVGVTTDGTTVTQGVQRPRPGDQHHLGHRRRPTTPTATP